MIKNIFKLIFVICILQYTSACEEGVTGGTIESSFQGVGSHTVLSPTAIELRWLQQDKYREYQVFELGQVAPLEVSIFDNYTVEGLSPNTEYVFQVIAIDQSNTVFGDDNELRVRTMPEFTGITSVERNLDNEIVVSWDFPQDVYRYHIFVNEFSKPTAASTNNWADSYVSLTSGSQSHTFTDLAGSTQFFFQVHVEYRPGEFTRPDQEITESTPTSFPDPLFNLPAVTIGSLPFASINPVVNSSFEEANYSSQFFHGATALSDPLVGTGVVSFLDSANLGLGRIDNITLKVSYSDSAINETFVQNGLSTYVKGSSPVIDQPVSEEGFTLGTSELGRATASGDFNCDGFKDLAVSMPEASIGSLGVNSNQAGAVYIYYSDTVAGVTSLYTDLPPKIDPVRPGKDPQIITFSDSIGFERFGFSMSSGGNFNGDTLGGNPCEDLIVGAPIMATGINNNLRTGAAFVFFGNKNGLSASNTYSNIQDNIGTCNGVLEDSSCSAVRLWPDYSKWPSSVFPEGYNEIYGEGANATGWANTRIDFGYSVSFIGDFNADGFDDIAIGAPSADWDGEVLEGAPGESAFLQDTGAVMIYFGSRFGLGFDTPHNTETAARFPFIKIYPPIPHTGMRFGHSISNGADVNGNHKILGADGKYHGGSDFVIGAPGFYYPNPADLESNLDPLTPADGGWSTNYNTTPSNFYGFPQGDSNQATGAAFLYFGRDNSGSVRTTSEETPTRSNYWGCGDRSAVGIENHYSCLHEPQDYRILFPRNNTSKNFGSAVALLGAPSFYDENDIEAGPMIDPNQDGYAEIIVAASSGGLESGLKTNTGVLWQYFGNFRKYYEHNFATVAPPNAAAGYLVGSSNCDSFSSVLANNATNNANCRPTLLQANSFDQEARLGLSQEAITVGDLNGDDLIDLVVGAPFDSANGINTGAVLAFTSDPSRGITSNFRKLYSNAAGDDTELGHSVAVGNFNGDQFNVVIDGEDVAKDFNDIASGGPGDNTHRSGSGSAHIFLTSGFHLPSLRSDSDIQLYDNLGSPQNLGYQRSHIVGDINGDGYEDAAGHTVRYNNQGEQVQDAVIFYGSEDHGLVTSSTCLAKPAEFVNSGSGDSCFPQANRDVSLAKDGVILPQLVPKYEVQHNLWADYARPAGDVNGDGFDDIIFFGRSGRYELFFGSTSGIISTDRPQWVPSSGNPQIVTDNFNQTALENQSFNSPFNKSADNRDLIKMGDFNQDGYSDIVITNAFASSQILTDAAGNPQAWDCIPAPEDQATIEACAEGHPVTGHGLAVVFYGSPLGLQTPSMDTANFSIGQDVDLNNPATFVDIYGTEAGDAPCDANDKCKVTLIRNPVFTNINYGFQQLGHRFGSSSSVLNVDDPGLDIYDDLLVGAYEFEDLGCYAEDEDNLLAANYGRVYIFRGSAGGLVAAEKTDYYNTNVSGNCPGIADNDTALTSSPIRALHAGFTTNDNRSRNFAKAMTTAGDVNGDGYEDLLVGSDTEDINGVANVGAHYIFYGPLCSADNSSQYSEIYGQQASNLNVQLTVNDVVANVPVGTECNPNQKLPWQKFYIKGKSTSEGNSGINMLGARKGKSDINGDGFDDVVIGSPFWDDDFTTLTDVGRGVIYFGSQFGLYTEDFPSINVAATELGQLRPYSLQGPIEQSGSHFFANTFSMGDFNNDGTADLLIPSYWFDGLGDNRGINIGVFFTFY